MSPRVIRRSPALQVRCAQWRSAAVDSGGGNSGPTPVDPEKQGRERDRLAYERGRADGINSVAEECLAKTQAADDFIARSIESVGQFQSRIVRESERDLVALSVAIARRIVHREISTDPDALHGLVKAALEKLTASSVTRTRVHPTHVDAVRRALESSPGGSEVGLVGDPELRPGDLLFETDRGDLDASVDSQLKEIAMGLVDSLDQ